MFSVIITQTGKINKVYKKDNNCTVEILSKIASLLDNKIMRENLRQAKNESDIISLLKDDEI